MNFFVKFQTANSLKCLFTLITRKGSFFQSEWSAYEFLDFLVLWRYQIWGMWISNIMNCLCLDHKSPSLCLSSYFLASISHTAIGFLAPPSSRQYYELFTLESPITPSIPLFLYIFEKIWKTANEVFWGEIQYILYTQR